MESVATIWPRKPRLQKGQHRAVRGILKNYLKRKGFAFKDAEWKTEMNTLTPNSSIEAVKRSQEYISLRQKEVITEFRSLQREQTEHQNTAHERLLRVATQISVLFLTGWVALLSVGKIGTPPIGTVKEWLFGCCSLHVLTLGLICAVEWKVMRMHFDRSENIVALTRDFEAVVMQMIGKVNAHLPLPTAAPPNLLEHVLAVEKTGWQALREKDQEMLQSYNKRNKVTWGIGVFALFVLIMSFLVSTTALIFLIKP